MRRSLLLLVAVVAVLTMGLTIVGTASAGGGFTFEVRKTTNFNSVDRKDISVRCPEFSERTGGGAYVNGRGSRRHVAIHKSRAVDNEGWRAAAHETTDNYGRKWSLTVQVVCVGGPR